jgi:hypothetical protein
MTDDVALRAFMADERCKRFGAAHARAQPGVIRHLPSVIAPA